MHLPLPVGVSVSVSISARAMPEANWPTGKKDRLVCLVHEKMDVCGSMDLMDVISDGRGDPEWHRMGDAMVGEILMLTKTGYIRTCVHIDADADGRMHG